jgi:hypothetical protein
VDERRAPPAGHAGDRAAFRGVCAESHAVMDQGPSTVMELTVPIKGVPCARSTTQAVDLRLGPTSFESPVFASTGIASMIAFPPSRVCDASARKAYSINDRTAMRLLTGRSAPVNSPGRVRPPNRPNSGELDLSKPRMDRFRL